MYLFRSLFLAYNSYVIIYKSSSINLKIGWYVFIANAKNGEFHDKFTIYITYQEYI